MKLVVARVVVALAAAGPIGCAPASGDDPSASGASASAPESQGVTIEYIAHAAFLITGPDGTSLLIDPYESRWWLGYDFPALEEDPTAVLLSHPHPDHDAGYEAGRDVPWGESSAVLTSPGQYVFDEINVRGVRGKHADPYGEEFGQRNTIWLVETGGLRIAHIGDNGPVTDEIVQALGHVDVLMIPVDDVEHILTHAAVDEWRARLSPKVMIPMHYRHDDIEIDPESPSDLASIDDWLSRQIDFGRLPENHITITADDLPPAPRIWVFPHSPGVVTPS
jgi:L-ascorbate metabolism protein UlaG (beta-lactamase superfamily)